MKEIDLFHVMSSDVVISGPKVTIYAIKLTSLNVRQQKISLLPKF